MDSIDWKLELSKMLDTFESESAESFGIINQRFVALGLTFDEEFQENVLKMANIRLKSSFTKIAMAQWGARQTSNNDNQACASNRMEIFAQSTKGKTIKLEVKPSDTIRMLKETIQAKEGVRLGRKRLLFRGTQLEDDRTVLECDIQNRSTLNF